MEEGWRDNVLIGLGGTLVNRSSDVPDLLEIAFLKFLIRRVGPEVNTSPLVHEVASTNPGKYQCVFFNA